MAYTTTASVDYAQTAYDRLAYFAYRPELYYDRAVEVKPTRQSMPGSTVVFTIQNDLPIASTALNESTDLTPVAMSDSQVSVALAEYGNVTVTTAKLRGEAFVEIDPIQANVVGYNAAVSIDEIAKNIAEAGTTVDYATGTGAAPISRASITPLNTFGAANVRLEKARLRRANVPTFGGAYVATTSTPRTCPTTSRARPARTPGPTRTRTPSPTRSGRERSDVPRGPLHRDPEGTVVRQRRLVSDHHLGLHGPCSWARQALCKAHSIVDGNGDNPHIVPVVRSPTT